MGIQINGNTNNINAGIGSLSIEDLREIDIVGVATASNFKTGSSNLHSTGLTVGNALVHSTGINVGTGATIHAPATNVLTLGTNSNERLRIDTNGYLIAKADIRLRRTASNNGALYFGDSNNNYIFGSDADDLITFATAGSERFRIDSSGRLLLGTTSSAYKLCVADNTNASLVSQLVNTNTGSSTKSIFQIQTGADRYINFENDYTGQYLHVVGNNITTLYQSFDTQIFRNNAGTERLRINATGYVGIRRENPLSWLHISNGELSGTTNPTSAAAPNTTYDALIVDGQNVPVINMRSRGDGNQSYAALFFSDNVRAAGQFAYHHVTGSDTDFFRFTVNASTIPLEIDASGLNVSGNLTVSSALAKIVMNDTDGGDSFQIRNDGGNFKIRNSTDGRDDINITNNNLTLGGVLTIQDNNSIFFGSSQDIEMRHNATSSQNQIICKNHNFLLQSYGTIYMQCFQSGNSTNGNVLTANYNNGTALYYQNGERLVTQNGGCKISSNLHMANWLYIGKNGGQNANASVGHNNTYAEGIFWHTNNNYAIFRTVGNWSDPYAQLELDWPTGIKIDGGSLYGLSGARFNCNALPTTNNNYDLGTSALRWRDVYCNQGAFNNSDIELKQDIASLTAAEMKAAKRLSALFKTYRWKDAVEEKGTDKARTHTGMIAQQIQAAMSAEGLDATKYGLFGTDEWYENDKKEIITLDQLKDNRPDPLDSSKTISPMSTEGYTKVTRYSVRYTELLSFIAAYNDQRFADLESRVAALESS